MHYPDLKLCNPCRYMYMASSLHSITGDFIDYFRDSDDSDDEKDPDKKKFENSLSGRSDYT